MNNLILVMSEYVSYKDSGFSFSHTKLKAVPLHFCQNSDGWPQKTSLA